MTSLSITPITPLPGARISKGKSGASSASIDVAVQITLSCGCPTCAGGRFDASRFQVSASIFAGPEAGEETRLSYTGRASEFAGTLSLPTSGRLKIHVKAYDPETGMAGRHEWEIAAG